MRTKYYFVLMACMLIITNLYSQSVATFDYLIDVRAHLKGTGTSNDAEGDSRAEVTAVFEDGSEVSLINMPLNGLPGGTTVNWTLNRTYKFSSSNKIVSLKTYAIRQGCDITGCKTQYEGTVETPIQDIYPCATNSAYQEVFFPGGYSHNSDIVVTLHPVYNTVGLRLATSETAIGDLDANTIIGPARDWANSSNFFIWQYQLQGETTWNSFPTRFMNEESVTLNATELFEGTSYNVNQLAGKNVFVRIDPCSGHSNTLTLALRKSAPEMLVAPTPPTCSYKDDARLKLIFDRLLLPNESLVITLKNSSGVLIASTQVFSSDVAADNSYTLENLPANSYYIEYQNRIMGNTETISSPLKVTPKYSIISPQPVTFDAAKTDVFCYGGADGTSVLTAAGGSGSYQYVIRQASEADTDPLVWNNFSGNSSHTIIGLTATNYILRVQDTKGCVGTSNEQNSKAVTIGQPVEQLVIQQPFPIHHPSAFGASDGYVEVDIRGGTANADGSYPYEWHNNTDHTVSTGTTPSSGNSVSRIRFSNLAQGQYQLIIKDSKQSSSPTPQGCTVNAVFSLQQPDPLLVALHIQDTISCNGENNGTLVASAQGGIAPYQYQWKKNNNGVWGELTGYTAAIASGLSAGLYAVMVTDANGISLATDSIFYLPEPEPLQVNFSVTNISCSGMKDGAAQAIVTGGNSAYTYQWSNGYTNDQVDHLAAGSYYLWITDSKGCQLEDNVVVAAVAPIVVTATKIDPLCYNSTNGAITLSVEGGVAPYGYEWMNSTITGNNRTNLSAGTYEVKVTDAAGCFEIFSETITNPAPIIVDLGPDRAICMNQTLHYDITVSQSASYQWRSADGLFSSSKPVVDLTTGGVYIARITDANGCESNTDTVILATSPTNIVAEVAVPSHGFTSDTLVFTNLSYPVPDSIVWILPNTIQIIQQNDNYARALFKEADIYTIGLKTYKEGCEAIQSKQITITKKTNLGRAEAFIKQFEVSPNPSNGDAVIKITLEEAATVQPSIVNIQTGQVIRMPLQTGHKEYTVSVSQYNLAAGIYVVTIEVGGNYETRKLVIL